MEETPLAAAFLNDGPVQIELSAPIIEERIQSMFAAGRAAWPEVVIVPRRFARHLGHLARVARSPGEWLLRARPDGLYLACACADGDSAALAHFESKYMSQLPGFVASFQLAPDRLDELRQQLRHRLFVGSPGPEARSPKIAEYAGEGALAAWLQTVARRLAIGEKRKADPAEPVGDPPERLVPGGDPEIDLIRRENKRAFNEAVRDALAVLTPESRTLLRLSYLERVGIDKLAVMFQIHRATAARRVVAAGDALRAETLRLLKERLGLNDAGLRSFIGAMSDLHISIAGALLPPQEP